MKRNGPGIAHPCGKGKWKGIIERKGPGIAYPGGKGKEKGITKRKGREKEEG